MEFRFNVNEVLKQPIVEINSSLIPPGLSLADKRALWDAVGKVSDVVNTMGEASATAQGLTKPITTSERLRNSDHKLYLLIDHSANNGKGGVTGMLKTGRKGLYVFDRDGHHYQVSPPCVLDFYIHESKQRMGLGKKLFEHMLGNEQVEPVKMAIDRPSDKFLGFLNKHYTLDNPVKQMNNFVVFDGFFPETKKEDNRENNNTPLAKSNQSANGLQSSAASPYGRYGAPRPPCSMGQIIHNQSPLAQQTQEPAGTSLFIRAPTKIRSAYSDKQPQEVNSNGNPQITQSTPNMPNNNQNYSPQQQYQNQQMPYQTQNMSPNQYMQSLNQQQYQNQPQYQNSQNAYPQSGYPQYQNQPLQNYYQQNQFDPNAINGQQQNFNQTQQYNTPLQPVQGNSEIQLQPKKSVQFAPLNHQIPRSDYAPAQTQSAYDQRNMTSMQENQQKSLPNVSHQQQQQNPAGDNRNITQNVPRISQNIQENIPTITQTIQHAAQQNLPQRSYQSPQNPQTNYNPQQSQIGYQQQIAPRNQQSQQPVYQQTLRNNPTFVQDVNPSIHNMPPQHHTNQEINNDTNQIQVYNEKPMTPNYYQNLPNPVNYSAANLHASNPQSNQNTNYQQPPTPSAQNIQIPPQTQYSQQPQQQIDPTEIMPPVETINNQNKNYQYYDSNQGRIQSEYTVKQTSENDVPMSLNASGDMQPIAE